MTRRAPAVAALLAGLLALAACDREPPPAGTADLPAGRADRPPPDQVVEDGEHVITVDGVKQAVLRAEQLYFYNETGTVIGDTIQVDFYDESGAFVSMMTALTGEIDQRTQDMTATGNVFVRGTDATIKTEELTFDPVRDRISSETDTEIVQQGNVIRGRGVESDPALKEIRIRGGSAVLRSEPGLGRESERDPAPDAQATPPQVAPPAPEPTGDPATEPPAGAGDDGA